MSAAEDRGARVHELTRPEWPDGTVGWPETSFVEGERRAVDRAVTAEPERA